MKLMQIFWTHINTSQRQPNALFKRDKGENSGRDVQTQTGRGWWHRRGRMRTLVFSSKRPFGVRSMILGGRKGYSAGSMTRAW